jgi:hypothetical protein
VPRMRMVKPEVWADERLAPLDPVTRLVWLFLISWADDAGRVHDNVKMIDANLFSQTDDSARASLDILANLSRIRRGVAANGARVIQIVNWERHQRVDKPNLAAALPPIVDTSVRKHSPEPIREAVANDSRASRGSVAPYQYQEQEQDPEQEQESEHARAGDGGMWPERFAALARDAKLDLPGPDVISPTQAEAVCAVLDAAGSPAGIAAELRMILAGDRPPIRGATWPDIAEALHELRCKAPGRSVGPHAVRQFVQTQISARRTAEEAARVAEQRAIGVVRETDDQRRLREEAEAFEAERNTPGFEERRAAAVEEFRRALAKPSIRGGDPKPIGAVIAAVAS